MMEQIISALKDRVGGDLVHKLGLDHAKADAAVNEAGTTLNDVAQKEGPSSLMQMFSSGDAGAITNKFSEEYLSKLTGKLGLEPSTAARVKEMVLPALMAIIQNKAGDLLGSFMGGKDGAGEGIADKLGGLGKMFGK